MDISNIFNSTLDFESDPTNQRHLEGSNQMKIAIFEDYPRYIFPFVIGLLAIASSWNMYAKIQWLWCLTKISSNHWSSELFTKNNFPCNSQTCGNYGNSLFRILGKNFVKVSNVFAKVDLTKHFSTHCAIWLNLVQFKNMPVTWLLSLDQHFKIKSLMSKYCICLMMLDTKIYGT